MLLADSMYERSNSFFMLYITFLFLFIFFFSPIQTVLIYARYTLSDNTLLEYLDYFKSQNLGIICAAAHALGMLTNAGPQSWHPAPKEQKQLAQQAAQVCRDRGVELGKLAMYYTIQLADVATFLTGMQTRELLDINLNAFYNGLDAKEQEVLQYIKEK